MLFEIQIHPRKSLFLLAKPEKSLLATNRLKGHLTKSIRELLRPRTSEHVLVMVNNDSSLLNTFLSCVPNIDISLNPSKLWGLISIVNSMKARVT